jgi:peptidylprolyl isomerase
MKITVLGITLALATTLAACTTGAPEAAQKTIAPTPPASPAIALATPTIKPAETPAPTPAVANLLQEGEGIVTASGVRYIELKKGAGPFPKGHDVVVLHYVGMMPDGTVFDSSYARGEPIMYTLGEETTFDDWNEAIQLMQIGGEAKIIIPPELVVGNKALPDATPSDQPFIYKVKLVAVSSQDAYADIKETDYTLTDSGLKYYDFETGDGPAARAGQLVSIHYTAWREAGEVFDSTLDRGRTFSFILGAGHVLPGLDEGIAGMKVGGSRQLFIPPKLGYGEQGYGLLIDPTENIVYEVMLVNVQPAPPPSPDAPRKVAEADYTVTGSGLKYYDFKVGKGVEARQSQMAEIHYTGWLTDGTKFDSSLDYGNPVQLPVGIGGVLPGLDEGILGMRVGGVRQLVIPPALAYGEMGDEDFIPPNAILIFEIELLDVQ